MTDAELHEYLSNLVRYIPETGEFFSFWTWETKRLQPHNGYLHIMVGRKRYRAHRLAWFLTHGYWPKLIDHIDRDKTNNRLSNLRDATPSENARNRSHRPTRHVHIDLNGPRRKRYLVKIHDSTGKRRYFGRFLTKDLAMQAAQKARDKLGIV